MALLARVAIAVAVVRLEGSAAGVIVQTRSVGAAPVTVFRPAAPDRGAPVVLIARMASPVRSS
jgi:hypothetical protein